MSDMSESDAHMRSEIESCRCFAALCRGEAKTLITRAEIWEMAAIRLNDALDKDRLTAHPVDSGPGHAL